MVRNGATGLSEPHHRIGSDRVRAETLLGFG